MLPHASYKRMNEKFEKNFQHRTAQKKKHETGWMSAMSEFINVLKTVNRSA